MGSYLRRMIRWFKDVLLALRAIVHALGGIAEAIHGLSTQSEHDAGLATRVGALELEMERRHAEAEGLLLKAKGKFDAARAAEERTRRLANGAEESEEELEEAIRAAYADAGIQLEHGELGQEEGVQPMRGGMASRHESKSNAHAMKYGRAAS